MFFYDKYELIAASYTKHAEQIISNRGCKTIVAIVLYEMQICFANALTRSRFKN